MNPKVANIIIVETSEIIYEGISSILTNTGHPFNIHQADDLSDLEQICLKAKAEIIFINPLLIQNQIKHFHSLKRELNNIYWIGIVYSFIDPHLLSVFDDIVNINDKRNKIIITIKNILFKEPRPESRKQQQEVLSEREIDVLKLLVAGNANKEIAANLNISAHTVISHRKNISQKTGIKSVSALTIYAVVKNIIAIDNYRE
jgi:DNA-binding CsgD family transcriptional regulator